MNAETKNLRSAAGWFGLTVAPVGGGRFEAIREDGTVWRVGAANELLAALREESERLHARREVTS